MTVKTFPEWHWRMPGLQSEKSEDKQSRENTTRHGWRGSSLLVTSPNSSCSLPWACTPHTLLPYKTHRSTHGNTVDVGITHTDPLLHIWACSLVLNPLSLWFINSSFIFNSRCACRNMLSEEGQLLTENICFCVCFQLCSQRRWGTCHLTRSGFPLSPLDAAPTNYRSDILTV